MAGKRVDLTETKKHVALMATCLGDQVMPQAVVSAVRLLKRAGYLPNNAAHQGQEAALGLIEFPQAQTCCGQMFANTGNTAEAVRRAQATIEIFEPFDAVVLPSGSCSAMIRVEYAHLFTADDPWHQRSIDLASKTFELSEFLFEQTDWRPTSHPHGPVITMHDSCHMKRLLGLGTQARELLKQAGCTIREMNEPDRCCGFGGMFSVKMPEISNAMSREKIDRAEATGSNILVSADPGCLQQLQGLAHGEGRAIEIQHFATLLESLA
jgi:L-lactate dehydrogenase complex protein LldE